jgi:predicted membrane protein
MDSAAGLYWAMLFGAIGLGFFTYGKRQRAAVPLAVGIALFVYPYFVPNVTLMVVIGVILIAVPYFVKI